MPTPDDPEDRAAPDPRSPGRAGVVYWVCAGALYVALGVIYPPAFLLGFQESLPFVFLVTVLQPIILRWFR